MANITVDISWAIIGSIRFADERRVNNFPGGGVSAIGPTKSSDFLDTRAKFELTPVGSR